MFTLKFIKHDGNSEVVESERYTTQAREDSVWVALTPLGNLTCEWFVLVAGPPPFDDDVSIALSNGGVRKPFARCEVRNHAGNPLETIEGI